jgi:hypothetical protein
MNAILATEQTKSVRVAVRRVKQTGGKMLEADSSREARQMAAAILEVLAGARTPAEAATALSISVPRYYQVEARALQGLLKACEAKPKGRSRSPERQARVFERENERLRRELTRQQSLVRIAQRTIGLPAPPAASAVKSGKKTRRRRVARALSVATRLHHSHQESTQPLGEASSPGEL